MTRLHAPILTAVVASLQPVVLAGADEAGSVSHTDPFAGILLTLGLVIAAAVIGRVGAARLGQPEVLGELVVGVILGNTLLWLGFPLAVLIMHQDATGELSREVLAGGHSVAEAAREVFGSRAAAGEGVGAQLLEVLSGPYAAENTVTAVALWIFSGLGVILLLFMVGLESSVSEMVRVGPRALVVAVIGVVAPFGLGYVTVLLLLPDAATSTALFLGATLCATSVGITARVFKDLDRLSMPETRMILGAAVIDDVLGLVILALVAGLVSTGQLQPLEVVRLLALAAIFLGFIILLGERISRSTVGALSRFEGAGLKIQIPLIFAFSLAWLANQLQLAAIVGAFAAGLMLSESHFDGFSSSRTVKEMIKPLESVFAPVFFVLMGMQVNLDALFRADTLLLSAAFIVAAVAGKMAAGLPAGPRLDSLSVGIGMVPRGEVGLIFASIGRGLGVMDDAVFSAVVAMVMMTTLMAPIGLKWSLGRRRYEPSRDSKRLPPEAQVQNRPSVAKDHSRPGG